MLRKDRMKLYQHSAHCPVAMQIFLDANPHYWRFMPMLIEDARKPEQQSSSLEGLSNQRDQQLRSKEDCFVCMEAIPKPPSGYTFSNRQFLLQAQYFHNKRDQIMPNPNIDLYNATIVAVCKYALFVCYLFHISSHTTIILVPETCSDMFRSLIESLFITYAQTQLNSIGNLLAIGQQASYSYPVNDPWLLRGDEWCQGLVRRPQPKPMLATKTTK